MCPFRAFFLLLQLHLVFLISCVSGSWGGSAKPASSASSSSTSSCPFRVIASRMAAYVPQPSGLSSHYAASHATKSRQARHAMTPYNVKKAAFGRLLSTTTIAVQPAGGVALNAASVTAPPTSVAAPPSKPQVQVAAAKSAAVVEEKEVKKEKKRMRATGPMEVHVIGLSIHTASVDVREKLAIPEANWNEAAQKLCTGGSIAEAAVLSTCNRFEVYFAAQDSYAAFFEATKFLEQHSGIPQTTLRKNLFLLSGEDCIWHLLRVAGGLDSLVVGEGQILSQVKQCYNRGIEATGKGGKVISRLLNTAVAAGKRVRAETGISKGAVSISSAAVEFTQLRTPKDLNKPFDDCNIAIIGAGKMSRLLLIHMASQDVKKVTLLNRGRERAETLAAEFPDIEIDIKLMDQLWPTVHTHDVIYASTSSQGLLITKDEMDSRGVNRPQILVDISVPRNIEPQVTDREASFAYNVDDLRQVVERNTARRKKEMLEAEDLLLEELEKFRSWQFSLGAIPAITRLQEKAEAMRLEELKKAAKKLNGLSDKELETVERLTKGIVNKLLHGPMSHLRATENLEKNLAALKTLKAVFEL